MARRWRQATGAALIAAALAGCAGGGGGGEIAERRWSEGRLPRYDATATGPVARQAAPLRVGLLLPLSGPYAAYGRNLLDAAALAMFDAAGARPLALLPRDTGGGVDSAASAAVDALASGGEVLIGPALADAGGAVRAATAAGAPLLVPTADRRLAAPGVFAVGAAPEAAATRVVDYAYRQGARRIAVIAPETADGAAALRGFRGAAAARGVAAVEGPRLPARPSDADARAAIRAVAPALREGAALFLPFGPDALPAFSAALRAEAPDAAPLLLGPESWDSGALAQLPGFERAVFAGADPAATARFRARYAAAFGAAPVREAALIYDLTLMLASAGEDAVDRRFAAFDLAEAAGFQGVEGPFRLTIDGVVQRRHAIVGLRGGRLQVLEPAAAGFDG